MHPETARASSRRLGAAAVLACLTAACAGPGGGGSTPGTASLPPPVLDRLKRATVFVQVGEFAGALDPEGAEGSGSGFFVAPDGRVATSWHVVSPLKRSPDGRVTAMSGDLRVIVRSGARDQAVLPARLLAVDAEADLALLKVEAEGCAWLPLGDDGVLAETAPLWVAGFPLGRLFSVLQRGPEISVNFGHVSSLRHDDRGRLERIQFDAAVVPGNSGGPVIDPSGRVLGVAAAAIGTSRVNFAVPVGRLAALLAECPPDRAVGPDCAIEVVTDPPGATVHLDGVPIGTTPLKARAPGGYRRLVAGMPGRRAWARGLCIYDGRRIEAVLEPLPVTTLRAVPAPPSPAGGGKPMDRGDLLFAEPFADPAVAEAWEQDVGGTDERSWYVQDGELRQFSDDGALHAVFAGDTAWTDYAVSARVKIAPNEKDGRAGLIFRASDDGFALFRLHRATSRVQLAYHCTRPFGWQVFDERTLPFQVQADTWYRLEVQARGGRVLALIDGRPVLEASIAEPARGRIGFYSVDSRAAFRDAEVRRIETGEVPAGAGTSLRSFWFTEHFLEDLGYWRPTAGEADATPWTFLHGGCAPPGPGAADACNLVARYDIHDLAAACAVQARSGAVGLVFRADGKRRYVLAADPAAGKLRLLLRDGAEGKELGTADLPEATPDEGGAGAAGRLLVLTVSARGDRIRAGCNGGASIDVRDATLKHGNVGLYADRAEAIFLQLNVNSEAP